jgi:hypothetical protein
MVEVSTVTHFSATVSREIRPDGIVLFRIRATDHESVDVWARACITTNRILDPKKTSRTMHCVDDTSGLVTLHAHRCINEVIKDSVYLKGYTAIVVQRTLTIALIETIWRHLAQILKRWDMKIFFHENGAIAWLLAQPDMPDD